MAPIRIALIGLSASAKTSWAAEAHLPYLLSPRGRRHYAVVALLNSSVNAAEAARSHFCLPDNVKTYGDPELLAQDPDVDLVVCCTRVDTHSSVIAPSVRAGKAVYVEWPLTENLHSAEELTALAAEGGGGAIVGLQGRVAKVVLKIKEVVESGRIGRVLASDVEAYGNLLGRDELPAGLAYFAERRVGGNPVTIAFAHMVDYVHHVLGEFEEGWESRMQIQRAAVKVIGDGEERMVRSDVPDFIAVHGALKGRNTVEGATLAVRFRNGTPFKGRPGLAWRIVGEKGEVEVESPAGPYLHSDSYDKPIRIRVHDHGRDVVEAVEWEWEDWQEELPVRARNVGEVYERYATWVRNGKRVGEENWPGIEDGLVRMKELDILFKRFDEQFV
ncbi:Dehydrogenase aclE [Colletotrichum gloeosporioides]|uniref:Dehydrogenase aclE n=1 Tax=Colletotrichum gloeosporioides TaxID=474922 RepID=A0A8H4CD30_COLGL|nr:Dehydrogenase aclE [Colletotrichum gloeosporioides]KAF3801556.1 Dehydrogenase aclE [Colletotrichum gloeosporioides]